MSVKVIDTLKPKNDGAFPIAEAADIAVTAEKRLPEALADKADLTALNATNAAVATKANASDVTTVTNNLQGQIDQIEISATAEAVVAPEVAAARVSEAGITYNTLKSRLDNEQINNNGNFTEIYKHVGDYDTRETDLPTNGDYYMYTTAWYTQHNPANCYGLTDYIQVVPGSKVTISAFFRVTDKIASYAIFDENKNAIHYGDTTNDGIEPDAVNKFLLDYEITLPLNARYIKVVAWKNAYLDNNPFYVDYKGYIDQTVNDVITRVDDVDNSITDIYKHIADNDTEKTDLPSNGNYYLYTTAWYEHHNANDCYGLTDYIPVIPNTKVVISAFLRVAANIASYAIFDKNKTAIHYGDTANDGVEIDTVNKFALDYEINLPSNAAYIKVVAWKNAYLENNPFYVRYKEYIENAITGATAKIDEVDTSLNKTITSAPTDGNYIYYEDDTWKEVTNTSISFGMTDFIKIKPDSKMKISAFIRSSNDFATYILYDTDKTAIHYGSPSNDGISVDTTNKFILDYEINIPSEAVYIRIVAWKNKAISDVPFYYTLNSDTQAENYDRVLRVSELSRNQDFDLFVFAGQSNMMGAAALPPKDKKKCYYAYEYLYNPKRLGSATGKFKYSENSSGEWSYKDVTTAYASGNVDANGKSKTTDYATNTYFVSAMSNVLNEAAGTTTPFSNYSESTCQTGCNFATSFAREYASYGYPSIYAVMAKGSVQIEYYLTTDVQNFFAEKYQNMLTDFAAKFEDGTIRSKNFVWCQGESNASDTTSEYTEKLEQLWAWLQTLGFEKMFIVRVGYWGNAAIKNIIQAQEDFCNNNDNCYIVTRAMSFMNYPGLDTDSWYINPPTDEYLMCRDSFYGFDNNHINEKGHDLVGKRMAKSVDAILNKKGAPVLEPENINGII